VRVSLSRDEAYPARMTLEIVWTRKALALPEEVRRELASRLNRLHPYFPEMKTKVKIGITRALDGLAFQSTEGVVKLMLDVRRRRDGSWKYPTYWTMAHELMHLAQFNSNGTPSGERACDVYALARMPPRFIDDSPSYLVVPPAGRKSWGRKEAALAHRLAVEAIDKRSAGLVRYAVWWENEFEKRL